MLLPTSYACSHPRTSHAWLTALYVTEFFNNFCNFYSPCHRFFFHCLCQNQAANPVSAANTEIRFLVGMIPSTSTCYCTQSEPLPPQTCPMAFLKPMHPGGSWLMTTTVPCLLHAWQHALSQFVLYTKKMNFYLSQFAAGLPGLWHTTPGRTWREQKSGPKPKSDMCSRAECLSGLGV